MPRLNGRGQAVCPGSGSGIVSIDGQPVWSGGSDGCWLDDDTIIGQECDGSGCHLATYHVPSGVKTIVDPQGANWVRANLSNVWAAWLNGVIRASGGGTWTGKYLCGVAKGGVLLTSGSLEGIEAYQPSGTFLSKITTGVLRDDATTGVWVRTRGDFLLWGEQNGSWHAKKIAGMTLLDVPITPRSESPYGMIPVDVNGVLWVAENCQGFLSLRPATSMMGYRVSPPGEEVWGPDAMRLADGSVKLAWSVAAGQRPDQLRTAEIELGAPRVDLGAPVVVVDPNLPHWPVVFRDGLVARVAAAESHGAMAVQFGTDPPITLPSYGMYPIGAIIGGQPSIIVGCVDDQARIVRRNGTLTDDGPTAGTDPVWIDDAGVVVRVETLFKVRYDGQLRNHPYPGGQGIAEAGNRPFDQIAWMDARLVGTVHGRSVCRWSAVGKYTVAQDAATGHGIAHNGVEWKLAIPAELPVAPRLTVLDSGGAVVTCFPGYVSPETSWKPLDAASTLPPVTDVPLLNRMFGFECYTFNNAKTAGNLTLPVRPTEFNWTGALVAPSDRPDLIARDECWSVYAGENAGLAGEAAIAQARPLADQRKRGLTIYQDSFGMRDAILQLTTQRDVVSCVVQLQTNESVDALVARVREDYARVSGHHDYWPTLNLVGDAEDAVQTFVAMTKLAKEQHWPGLRMFATGRSDVPLSTLQPYLDRFKSGITATPPPRIVLAPPPDGGGTPGGGTPPPVEIDMTKNVVLVDGLWQEVYQVKHVDEGRPGFPPLVGVRRVSDDKYLKVDENGRPFFDTADQAGQAEGLIIVPGAFVALRQNKNGVIERAGSWEQD